jgi:hypothetical protein
MRLSGRQTVIVFTTAGIWLVVFWLQGILQTTTNLKIRGPNRQLKTEHKACSPNKYKELLAGILQHWDKLAQLYNISYVIGLGSLLGLYRNGDIIQWDDDIDVLVDIVQYQKLRTLAEERNFVQGQDLKFRTVVQPDFEHKEEKKRRRITCYGKVSWISVNNQLKYSIQKIKVT